MISRKEIMDVLIRCAGNTFRCNRCNHAFTPGTANVVLADAFLLYTRLMEGEKIMDDAQRETVYHRLKTDTEVFQASINNRKSFEIRVNDRDFHVGDVLMLEEFDSDGRSTGDVLTRTITHIMHGGRYGLPENMVIMAVVPR